LPQIWELIEGDYPAKARAIARGLKGKTRSYLVASATSNHGGFAFTVKIGVVKLRNWHFVLAPDLAK
jgi:hypothetical protein